MGLKKVIFHNLGKVPFQAAHQVQMKFAQKHLDHKCGRSNHPGIDVLLITEHHPVYTIGLRTKQYNKDLIQELQTKGAEFVHTNRGGLITFHGPGQLVAYPILDLHHFNPSVRCYVSNLEQTVIHMCSLLGIQACTNIHTGVWVGESIHVSRYVTTHGLAINCNVDLSWFDHIIPCGLHGRKTTSLSKVLQQDTSPADVLPLLLHAFSNQFGCQVEEDTNLPSKPITMK